MSTVFTSWVCSKPFRGNMRYLARCMGAYRANVVTPGLLFPPQVGQHMPYVVEYGGLQGYRDPLPYQYVVGGCLPLLTSWLTRRR